MEWWAVQFYLTILFSMELYFLVLCKKISQIRRQSKTGSVQNDSPIGISNAVPKDKEVSKTTSTLTISKDKTAKSGQLRKSKKIQKLSGRAKASSRPPESRLLKVTAASRETSTTVKSGTSEDNHTTKMTRNNAKDKLKVSSRKKSGRRKTRSRKKHKKSKNGRSRKDVDLSRFKLQEDTTLDPGMDIEDLDAENDFPLWDKPIHSADHDDTQTVDSGRELSEKTPRKGVKKSKSYNSQQKE